MSEKLQKVLARKGLGSRRALEELIAAGRVSVNGVTAQLGDRVDDNVTVSIDSKVVLRPGEGSVDCRVLMYHKPEGELTTLKDPEDRPTVFDHLPSPGKGRWIYVGRLDINTSGLLLFTTDGTLANALMHPRHGIERVYAARIYGDVTEDTVSKLEHEVTLEDGVAHFDKVQYAGGDGRNVWFHCTLKEGRKREVRRLWEAVGCKVSRLIRISYGGIRLDPKLKSGEFRDLTLREVNALRKVASLEPLTEDEYSGSSAYGSQSQDDKSKTAFVKAGRDLSSDLRSTKNYQGQKKSPKAFARNQLEKNQNAECDGIRKCSRTDSFKNSERMQNKKRGAQDYSKKSFSNKDHASSSERVFSKGKGSFRASSKTSSKKSSFGSFTSENKHDRTAGDGKSSRFSVNKDHNRRLSNYSKSSKRARSFKG